MTKIRVLTGNHAGALIDWTHPLMKLGASEDDDIYIGDWNVQPVQLFQDSDGQCAAQWPHADGDPLAEGDSLDDGVQRRALQAWVPVRFGAIIFCIGPANEEWPDDADLLQRLFVAPAAAPVHEQPPVRRRRSPVITACFTLLALASSTGVVGTNHDAVPPQALTLPEASAASAASAVPAASTLTVASTLQSASAASVASVASAASVLVVPPEDPAALLRKALDDPLWRDLAVLETKDKIVVRGVLPSREDVVQVHRRLDMLRSSKAISRQFLDVGAVEDLIRESIPGAGLTVRRSSARTFEVSGSSKSPVRTEQAITRLSSDLDYLGVKVVSAVEATSVASARMSGTFIDTAGVSFARTRDGAKHIVAASPAASAVRSGRRADLQ